jgi:hypothetical protein
MKPIDPSLHWYVATYRNRPFTKAIDCARDAMNAIHQLGVDVYLPRKRQDVRPRRKNLLIETESPLMAPYLFVGLLPDAPRFKAVTDLDEVGNFIRSAKREPIPVPVNLIEAIFLSEVAGKFDTTARAKKARKESLVIEFPLGSAVQLVEDLKNVLDGARGVVAGHDAKRDRLQAEFGALRVWLDRDEVEAA